MAWMSSDSSPAGFADRHEAGRLLAERLAGYAEAEPVILALPRGGVPVAAEIAAALRAPLDLVLVRKIGVPGNPELAAAAVVDGERPEMVVNEDVARLVRLPDSYLQRQREEKLAEIARRRARYLGARASVPVEGRTVILVDDGLATGTTARAALKALYRRNPARVVLAVPVAPEETCRALAGEVDALVCLLRPRDFAALGQFYADFTQVGDGEVADILARFPAAPDSGGG